MGLRFYQRFFLAYWAYSYREIELNYPPLFFSIEPTNRCNFKCIYCPQSYSTGKNMEKGAMDMNLFEIIMQKIAQTKPINQIFLTGNGEPLLHSELEEFIRLTCKHHLRPSFTSNGSLLHPDRINSLATSGSFSITIDFSPYKELYEKNRIGGNWEGVYANLKNLLKFKKEKNRQDIRVTIKDMSTILLENEKIKKDSLADLQKLFSGLPVDSFVSVVFHNWIGNIDPKIVPASGLKPDYNPCSHPWSLMQINFKGEVVACCRDMAGEYIIGKIDNGIEIMQLWNNKKMIELRKALVEKRTSDIRTCRYCDRPYRGGSIGKNKWEIIKTVLTKRKKFLQAEI
ncbi:MAG TPA: radical SAM/SPASM domain-containing protein [candidate division Zixibacteria bacterium]